MIAAATQLSQVSDQLKALAAGQQVPNALFGIWDDQPATIAPTMESINNMIATAKTLLGN